MTWKPHVTALHAQTTGAGEQLKEPTSTIETIVAIVDTRAPEPGPAKADPIEDVTIQTGTAEIKEEVTVVAVTSAGEGAASRATVPSGCNCDLASALHRATK